jgi:hypothetical protein
METERALTGPKVPFSAGKMFASPNFWVAQPHPSRQADILPVESSIRGGAALLPLL